LAPLFRSQLISECPYACVEAGAFDASTVEGEIGQRSSQEKFEAADEREIPTERVRALSNSGGPRLSAGMRRLSGKV
jgi:hypothetical protein